MRSTETPHVKYLSKADDAFYAARSEYDRHTKDYSGATHDSALQLAVWEAFDAGFAACQSAASE